MSKDFKVGQSVILVSPRRYGKTSLIGELLDRLGEKGFYTANLDLFAITTRRQLAEALIEKILENRKVTQLFRKLKSGATEFLKSFEIKRVLDEFEFILKYSEDQISEQELLNEAFDFPEKIVQKSEQGLIVAFDEFGYLAKLNGPEILKLMRAKFQFHTNVSYLFSGSQERVRIGKKERVNPP